MVLIPSEKTLKDFQLAAVHRMLSLNEDSTSPAMTSAAPSSHHVSSSSSTNLKDKHQHFNNQWKILIYDVPCRSIISPLLSVSQLRQKGVTLHLLITADREPIPDVPAVYFVEPTRENLQRIAKDCARRLYNRVHINFVTKLDRSLMEEFGKWIVQSNCLDNIASLHDQYLDFICFEKHLFSLSNKVNSYMLMNGSGVTDATMEKYLEEVAYGLLSVVGTTGKLPILRCPKGGAPEMVTRKLNKLIADHPSTPTIKSHHNRPLLVILDRNMDLITPITHTSTYQALIDDLLQHKSNRVEFTVKQDNGRVMNKKFDLDADEDTFYSQHKFKPFPEAIESNAAELQQVTSRENAIRSKTGGINDDVVVDHESTSAASELATAVDSLPQLLEQKKQLEMHTSILQAVMNEVAARDVPQFFELESALASGQYKNDSMKAKQEVLELVTDPNKGNVEDKIRLVIVFCLATTAKGAVVTEVATKMAESLNHKDDSSTSIRATVAESKSLSRDDREKLERGLKAIEYLKNLRSLQMIPNLSDAERDYGTTSSGNSDILSSFMARATNQATGLLAKASEKVSTMLGKIHKHRTTRIVENLCDMKQGTEDDDYIYLDPKVKGDVDIKMLRSMSRPPFREVITFIIGGGCYAEYQNLQMIATERRVITYGSTELLNPCEFLQQLGKI